MVEVDGNKNIIINNGNNTGIICGVNNSTIIKGNNNFISTTFSKDGPKVYFSTEHRFCWKGNYYTDNTFYNEGFVKAGLEDLVKTWQSHLFGDFLNSLKKFDEMMEMLISEENTYIKKSSKPANKITIFTGRLFENFEGTYGKYCPYLYPKPFFLDYIVKNKKLKETWIIGYDTSDLEDDILFRKGIMRFETGDLHELYCYLNNWWEDFHYKLTKYDENTYKAIQIKDIGKNISSHFESIINRLKS